jgi:hypothetical protein
VRPTDQLYEICHVNDLASVPPERMDECLKELKIYVELLRFHRALFADMLAAGTIKLPECFPWKDDGIGEIAVQYHEMTPTLSTEEPHQ